MNVTLGMNGVLDEDPLEWEFCYPVTTRVTWIGTSDGEERGLSKVLQEPRGQYGYSRINNPSHNILLEF